MQKAQTSSGSITGLYQLRHMFVANGQARTLAPRLQLQSDDGGAKLSGLFANAFQLRDAPEREFAPLLSCTACHVCSTIADHVARELSNSGCDVVAFTPPRPTANAHICRRALHSSSPCVSAACHAISQTTCPALRRVHCRTVMRQPAAGRNHRRHWNSAPDRYRRGKPLHLRTGSRTISLVLGRKRLRAARGW